MLAMEAELRTMDVLKTPHVPHDEAPDLKLGSARVGRSAPSSPRRAALFMLGGLLVTAVASVSLLRQLAPSPGEVGAGAQQPASAPAPAGLELGGPSDVAVQSAIYEPGQRSGWHTHTGMHAVMVLSGTFTVYDGACRPVQYGPGDMYVGGQDPHLAINEGATPAALVVTYLFSAGRSHTEFHVPMASPPACAWA